MSKLVSRDEFGWNKVIYISFIIISVFINLITRLFYFIVHLARKVYWKVIHGEKMRVKKIKGFLVPYQEAYATPIRQTTPQTVKQVWNHLNYKVNWALAYISETMRTVEQLCETDSIRVKRSIKLFKKICVIFKNTACELVQ